LAAALALIVSAVFYQITSSAGGGRQGRRPTRGIVVAARSLSLGATIKPADLKVVPWGAETAPAGAFAKIEEAVERVALGNILPEEPVLDGRLAAKGAGLGLAATIPSGMRAVSVRVNDVISVAGFVLPGSRVDVLVTGVPRVARPTGPMTRTVLSNIQVVSAGKNIQPDSSGKPESVTVVTLLVNPAQAEVLTLAAQEGKIQLALRNNVDAQSPVSEGAVAVELFGGVRAPEEPAEKPAPPRVVTVRMPPPPAAATPPPPPPPPQIEMIRGEKKNTEIIEARYR
jgi:pilus assembly protein CpaB